MKKYLSLGLFLALGAWMNAQTITIDFTVGVLTNSTGSAAVADGSLFQVIASNDSVFTAPTTDSFIGGDDVIAWSGAFDSSTIGLAGAMSVVLSNISASTYSGDRLLVRWFPTLNSSALSPGVASYGEYGFPNDASWFAPAAGGTQSYSMVTVSAGGALSDTLGQAVYATAVPEPSTYALIAGLLSLGAIFWRRRAA